MTQLTTYDDCYNHLANAYVFRTFMDQPVYTDDPGIEDLQLDLIAEEYHEMLDAFDSKLCSRTECLKELADLVYVCYQLAAAKGWNLDEALERVHSSNMSKLVDGKPLRREDGKVLKGPNYQPPSLSDLV